MANTELHGCSSFKHIKRVKTGYCKALVILNLLLIQLECHCFDCEGLLYVPAQGVLSYAENNDELRNHIGYTMPTKSTQNGHLIMPKYTHLKVGGGIVQDMQYHTKVLFRANFFNEAFVVVVVFVLNL